MTRWHVAMTVNGEPVPPCDCLSGRGAADPHWSILGVALALGRPVTDADRLNVTVTPDDQACAQGADDDGR